MTALAGLGVHDAFAPADFRDLLARVPVIGPVATPACPRPGNPRQARPGGRASPPPLSWPRSPGRRPRSGRSTAFPPGPATAPTGCSWTARCRTRACPPTAGVVARRIAAEEAAGKEVQLHLLDLAGDRVVLALGDLDTADAVAVLVPGIGNTPADDLGGLVAAARHVGSAARAAAPGHDGRDGGLARVPAAGHGGSDRHADGRLARGTVARCGARRPGGRPAPRPAPGSRAPPSWRTATARWWSTRPRTCPDGSPPTPSCCSGSPGMEDDAASLEAAGGLRCSVGGRRRPAPGLVRATAAPGSPASARPGCPSDRRWGTATTSTPTTDTGRDRGGRDRDRARAG